MAILATWQGSIGPAGEMGAGYEIIGEGSGWVLPALLLVGIIALACWPEKTAADPQAVAHGFTPLTGSGTQSARAGHYQNIT